MNRHQIIEESQILEKQITDLKSFLSLLHTQEIVHHSNWNGLKSCLKRKITLSFLCGWAYSRQVEIEIPEFMRIEIAAKCKQWIEELERRADELVGV